MSSYAGVHCMGRHHRHQIEQQTIVIRDIIQRSRDDNTASPTPSNTPSRWMRHISTFGSVMVLWSIPVVLECLHLSYPDKVSSTAVSLVLVVIVLTASLGGPFWMTLHFTITRDYVWRCVNRLCCCSQEDSVHHDLRKVHVSTTWSLDHYRH